MSKFTSAAAMAIMGLFLVGMFAAPVNAVAPEATAPTWEEGDSWAMGAEIDLGSNVTDNLSYINILLGAYGFTVDDLDIESKASAYALFTVKDVTSTTYVLDAKLAFKFATQANVAVTGQMPKAGTYDDSLDLAELFTSSSVSKETKTVSVDFTEKMGLVLTAEIVVNKTSYGVREIDWGLRTALSVDATAKNIPSLETNEEEDEQTLSYNDYDMGIDLIFRTDLTMAFSPDLVIYQFPFGLNDYWFTTPTNLTVSGEVSGSLNAHGLPADVNNEIFTEDLFNATGARNFPISFDQLTTPGGEIENGEFGPIEEEIPATMMECTGYMSKTVGGVQYDVYTVQVDGGVEMYYSPGLRIIGGVFESGELPFELPEQLSSIIEMFDDESMEMDPVSTSTAEREIASIEAYTTSIESQANGGNSLSDFFFKAPYLGIIMVVVGAIVIAAMLFIGMRARKR